MSPQLDTKAVGLSRTDRVEFDRSGPLLLPFRDTWGTVAQWLSGGETIDLDPVTVPAASTSGSPVVLAPGCFVGWERPDPGGRLRVTDSTVTVEAPPGGALLVADGNPLDGWSRWNTAIAPQPAGQRPARTGDIDYCTWAEQRRCVSRSGGLPREALTEQMVVEFLARIDRLGVPRGTVTVDDGWSLREGPGGFGDWDIAEERFGSLARTAHLIRESGHRPGLWFAGGRAVGRSRLLAHHPQLLGRRLADRLESRQTDQVELADDDLLDSHYRAVLAPLVEMGFAKFKLDLFYGSKPVVLGLLGRIHRVLKDLDHEVEVEHHVPDAFAARYADVVRTNDVLVIPGKDWRRLTLTHWAIAGSSAPWTVLNLDYIGGNDPSVSETDFLAHLDLFRDHPGMPAVSLLPDRFSDRTQHSMREFLEEYDIERRHEHPGPTAPRAPELPPS